MWVHLSACHVSYRVRQTSVQTWMRPELTLVPQKCVLRLWDLYDTYGQLQGSIMNFTLFLSKSCFSWKKVEWIPSYEMPRNPYIPNKSKHTKFHFSLMIYQQVCLLVASREKNPHKHKKREILQFSQNQTIISLTRCTVKKYQYL